MILWDFCLANIQIAAHHAQAYPDSIALQNSRAFIRSARLPRCVVKASKLLAAQKRIAAVVLLILHLPVGVWKQLRKAFIWRIGSTFDSLL